MASDEANVRLPPFVEVVRPTIVVRMWSIVSSHGTTCMTHFRVHVYRLTWNIYSTANRVADPAFREAFADLLRDVLDFHVFSSFPLYFHFMSFYCFTLCIAHIRRPIVTVLAILGHFSTRFYKLHPSFPFPLLSSFILCLARFSMIEQWTLADDNVVNLKRCRQRRPFALLLRIAFTSRLFDDYYVFTDSYTLFPSLWRLQWLNSTMIEFLQEIRWRSKEAFDWQFLRNVSIPRGIRPRIEESFD